MARSKHAAALFEVMSSKKGNASRTQLSMRTPSWWFKSREESDVATAIDPNDPTTTPIKSSLIAPRIAEVEAVDPPQPVARQAATVPARVKRDAADPTRPVAVARPAPEISRAIYFDRARREVKLRLHLTHAIVATFGLVMVVALAYVMGKHESAPTAELATVEPAMSTTASVEPSHKSPAQPNVLDVGRPKTRPPGAGSTAIGGSRLPDAPRVRDHEFTSNLPLANDTRGMHVTPPVVDGPRTIGVNYVIAQSYPNEQIANDAHDFLVKSGVPCSVEKGPTGWANPNWYSVVTTRGFEHIHTPECENFKKLIEKAGDKFAGNGKFKRFEPMLYSWK